MDSLNGIIMSGLTAVCHIGGYYSIDKNTVWKVVLDIFAQNKFYYIKEGGCKITIKGEEIEGIPNRWFLIPAGTPHSYVNDSSRPFKKHWIHFDLFPENIKLFETMNIPYYVDVPNDSVADRLFEELESLKGSDKAYDVFKEKAALMGLIAEYIRLAAPEQKIKISQDEIIKKVVSYIKENTDKNITIDELAGICHLHPNHFIRTFKRKTGNTPAKFIELHKLETAKRLIEETDIPLSEVMSRVGIVDASQFSKKFRKIYGNSPRAFSQNICGRRRPL